MQIEHKIREFIVKNLYYDEDNTIADEDSFLETGVVDSMGVMELVAFIQSEFGVEAAQNEIVVENFDSIRKLADFVRRKLPAQPPAAGPSASDKQSSAPALVGG
ncbi:MAG TPA: acyl carrier protein [Candidatus Paceibacterota bacterium]|nr:acyl carrier protein [Verrucomicrobiota bacterium]HSA08827.1 acyl carrier protein [Candidatus Paceibacterota bacterium]